MKRSLEGCFEVVTRAPVAMADEPRLPHDRGHELWTLEDGPSRKLLSSIDRWVGAIVGDDGIDMPLSSASTGIEATVFLEKTGWWLVVLWSTTCCRYGRLRCGSLGMLGMGSAPQQAMKLPPFAVTETVFF